MPLHYWRCLMKDGLRYGRTTGRATARALSALARLERSPLMRLGLLCRAARLVPTVDHLRALKPRLDKCLPSIDATTCGDGRGDMNKGLIVKPPVSAREKGVLYLTFEKQWLRLLRTGKVDEIAREYDVVLGPSSSPPPHVELLLFAHHWPGRVYTLLSNFDDAELMTTLSPKLVPVPLLASSWVDPDAFKPPENVRKDIDLVMLAHFDPVKRHWLLFDALRRMSRSRRVLLMGVPLGGRDENDLMREARAFGVQDRFELLLRPTRAQVVSGLARARVSLVFSRQEGACIAVTESLFADTPVGLFRNARIGSKAFINEQTGRLLDRRGLARQLDEFVDEADRYCPRPWAVENISCHVGRNVLERVLSEAARERGREWTRGLLPFRKDLVPSYLSDDDAAEIAPFRDDFADRFGLLIGPAVGRALAGTHKGE